MVTGLRALAGAAPSGEWELHRTCEVGARVCGHSGGNVARRVGGRHASEGIRSVLTRARDMAESGRNAGSSDVVAQINCRRRAER
jgi:hypothetical protein